MSKWNVDQRYADRFRTDWMYDLLQYLKTKIEPLGSFATSGPLPTMPVLYPKVSVQGLESALSFPLMDLAVEPLKTLATKAPFGKGNETIVDETIRKAWQIDASQVSLGGGHVWEDYLQSIVEQCSLELGISKERVQNLGIHANLYKLLLYEAGGHFAVHRDTEKEPGMFGTLVIQLPSKFLGGAMSIIHEGTTKTFDLSESSDATFKYIAFYADCEHQLHPITEGIRISLVFNLVSSPTREAPTDAGNKQAESDLRTLTKDWDPKAEKAFGRLGFRLSHKYTPQSFHLASLKGHDAAIVNTLMNVKSSVGDPLFDVHFVLMERYVQNQEDSIQRDHAYAHTVLNRVGDKVDNSGWAMTLDWSGFMIDDQDYGRANEDETNKELYGAAAKEKVEGYLGNEVGDEERWYYSAAVVFSPFREQELAISKT